MTERARRRSRIPRFRTREEEAEFWDTHDTTEFEDEFQEVKIEFARPLIHIAELELSARTMDRISELARARGLGFGDLARQWLEERLEQEEAAASPKPAKRTAKKQTT
jgi:hypothetical protein